MRSITEMATSMDLLQPDMGLIRAREAASMLPTPAEATRQWYEDSFMESVGEHCGPEDVAVCRVLLAWCRAHADRVEWGRGAEYGSMRPIVRAAGVDQIPLTIWTSRGVEINFEQLKMHPPFRDEGLRRDLLGRLNAGPDVQLPWDSFRRRPSIPLQSLRRAEPQQRLFAAMEWAITLIRKVDSMSMSRLQTEALE